MNDIFGYPVVRAKLGPADGGYILLDDWGSYWGTYETGYKGADNMAIRIGLTGPDYVGKSTTARYLVDHFRGRLLANGYNTVVYSMAIPVYNIAASLVGLSHIELRQNKTKQLIDEDFDFIDWGTYDGDFKSLWVRDLLRGVGDGLRNSVHEDIWIQYMLRRTGQAEFENCVLFFDDIRYDNEADYMDLMFCLRRHGIDYSYHKADSPLAEERLSGLCSIDNPKSFDQMVGLIEVYLEKRGIL